MQNTVFLLYLHSGYTYSNKGGGGNAQETQANGEREENEEVQRMRQSMCNSQKRNSSEQSLPCQRKS